MFYSGAAKNDIVGDSISFKLGDAPCTRYSAGLQGTERFAGTARSSVLSAATPVRRWLIVTLGEGWEAQCFLGLHSLNTTVGNVACCALFRTLSRDYKLDEITHLEVWKYLKLLPAATLS